MRRPDREGGIQLSERGEALPHLPRAWVDLGVLYYTAEKFTDAIPCFAQAVSLGAP